MYKRRESSWLKHWDFMLLDFILLLTAFICSHILRFGTLEELLDHANVDVLIAIVFMDVLASLALHNHKNILRRNESKEFNAVVKLVATVYMGTLLWLFVVKQTQTVSRIQMVLFPILAIAMIYLGRILLKKLLRHRIRQSGERRGILLVCDKENWSSLLNYFEESSVGEFKLQGVAVLEEGMQKPELPEGIRFITDRSVLLSFLSHEWVDEVFFCTTLNPNTTEELVGKCLLMGITVHRALVKVNKSSTHRVLEQMGGYMVMSQSINVVDARHMFVKRVVDVMAGLVGTLFTGLLCLFIGPAIYIRSPGPIFFKQERIGKNGRRFYIYKFRSMYMDAEERKKELMDQNNVKDGYMFKVTDDPRIIKGIGNFIRNYSIDEFPQFFNVLKGDMSLIGTRPPTPDEWDKYELHHRTRLAIKPGITGAWQVSGRSDITDFEEVVELDVDYIRHWSLKKDLKILLKTVGVVLGKKGSDNR